MTTPYRDKTLGDSSRPHRVLAPLFFLLLVTAGLYSGNAGSALLSSVLPTSRSVEVGNTATAFATIVNTGPGTATGCSISPVTVVPADFLYQTTDPATNALTGTPNTPADIPEGGAQTYLFAFTPTAPFSATTVDLSFDCDNTEPAAVISGLNTLLLSASSTPVPDIIALSTTGILDMPLSANGKGVFAVAAINVGASGTITTKPGARFTGTAGLGLLICETDPLTGACVNPASPDISTTKTIGAGSTPTYAIFGSSLGTIPLDPANNRIFVDFQDSGGNPRGATSVAITSDVPSVPNIVGTYTGSGSLTVSNCTDPTDNGGPFTFTADLNISQQSINVGTDEFSGSLTLTTVIEGVTITQNDTISGTVDPQGALTGTLSGSTYINGILDSTHQGTFSGQATGNTITIDFVATDNPEYDTCVANGSLTVSTI